MICGDPNTPVEQHSEDYSEPFTWDPPADYALCQYCHRTQVHGRFRRPHAWDAYKAHVRRGGYASDLKAPEVKREVERLKVALAAGKSFELRELRPRVIAATEWWEALRLDGELLLDRAARPR